MLCLIAGAELFGPPRVIWPNYFSYLLPLIAGPSFSDPPPCHQTAVVVVVIVIVVVVF